MSLSERTVNHIESGLGNFAAALELVVAIDAAQKADGSTPIAGHISFAKDGVYDIGKLLEDRPRDIFVSRNIIIGNSPLLGAGGTPLDLSSLGLSQFGNSVEVIAFIGTDDPTNAGGLFGFQRADGSFAFFGNDITTSPFVIEDPLDVNFGTLDRGVSSVGRQKIRFKNNGSLKFLEDPSVFGFQPNLLWQFDNVGNIGSPDDGATNERPKNIYVGTSLLTPKVEGYSASDLVIKSGIASGNKVDVQSPMKFVDVTTVEKNALSVPNGTVVHDTDLNQLQAFLSGAWAAL